MLKEPKKSKVLGLTNIINKSRTPINPKIKENIESLFINNKSFFNLKTLLNKKLSTIYKYYCTKAIKHKSKIYTTIKIKKLKQLSPFALWHRFCTVSAPTFIASFTRRCMK